MEVASLSPHVRYCWRCHKDDTTIFCSTCTRSYHNQCAARVRNFYSSESWKCSECLKLITARKKAQLNQVDLKELNELLTFEVCELKADIRSHVIDARDWKKIERKLANSKYQCTLELIDDIKRIHYNRCIEHKNDSKMRSNNPLKQLLTKCREDIKYLELCGDCFRNSSEHIDWFSIVCKYRHQPVWAKLKGFPYWPAKVMEMKKDIMVVQFFGKHELGSVPSKNIVRYSTENPNGKLDENDQRDLDICMPEFEKYVKNFNKGNRACGSTKSNPEDTDEENEDFEYLFADDTDYESDRLEPNNDIAVTAFDTYVESLQNENERLKVENSKLTAECKQFQEENYNLKRKFQQVNVDKDQLSQKLANTEHRHEKHQKMLKAQYSGMLERIGKEVESFRTML